MADGFRYDVFLSHSSKDKPVVRLLAERLRADGVRVWFDEWVLQPGANIPHEIEQGLERSRRLVLCMSANAFGSDWTNLEGSTFRFSDPLNKDRRFIPLRMDDAPIRGSLEQFKYIRWQPEHREEDYALLLAACRASGAPIVEAPAPEQESSSFGRRNWLILVPSLGLLVALLTFIQRHSDTEMRVAGTGEKIIDGTTERVQTLLINVKNDGNDRSTVQRDFALEFQRAENKSLMTFGVVKLTGQDSLRVIAGNKSQQYLLDITSVKVTCDVTSDDFWRDCGGINVVLTGTAKESNGKMTDLSDTFPLREIRILVQDKRYPKSAKGACRCVR